MVLIAALLIIGWLCACVLIGKALKHKFGESLDINHPEVSEFLKQPKENTHDNHVRQN
jgi:hypothetical protein